jgi:hypothetical protein
MVWSRTGGNNKQSLHRRIMKIRAKISVEGIKPVLFCKFPMSTLTNRNSKTGNDEWKETVYMETNRQLYFPGINFANSIRDGGKEVKVGRSNLSKKLGTTIEVEETKVLIDRFVPEEKDLLMLDSEPVYLDCRSVVNPMTKGRNMRYRIAASPGWKCELTVTWDDYILSKEQMKVCVENAGAFQGIGDARRIGFGKYKILEFKVIK